MPGLSCPRFCRKEQADNNAKMVHFSSISELKHYISIAMAKVMRLRCLEHLHMSESTESCIAVPMGFEPRLRGPMVVICSLPLTDTQIHTQKALVSCLSLPYPLTASIYMLPLYQT